MIAPEYVNEIYVSRCKDTGERPKKEDLTLFKKQVLNSTKGEFVSHKVIQQGGALELRESRLGPITANSIVKLIKNNPFIRKIDLYGNGLRDPGTLNLIELLKLPNCYVQELNLGCNEIWDEGGKALGEVLAINKSVLVQFDDDKKVTNIGARGPRRIFS